MAWCGSFEKAFPFLKNAGYEGIELLVKNPDTIDKEYIKELLLENQLTVSAVGTTPMQREDGLFLLDPDRKKQLEAVRRLYGLIDLAAYFNAPVLIGKYRGMTADEEGRRLTDLENIIEGS